MQKCKQAYYPRAIASVCRRRGYGEVSSSYERAWRYTFATTHLVSETKPCRHNHQQEVVQNEEDEACKLSSALSGMGFPPSEIPQFLAQRYACSPNHLAKHLAFFKSMGIPADGFSKIVSVYPRALILDPDTDLKLSIALLESALGKSLVTECILSWPSLLELGYPQKGLSAQQSGVESPRQEPRTLNQVLGPPQQVLESGSPQEGSGSELGSSVEMLGLGLVPSNQESGSKLSSLEPGSMHELRLLQQEFADKIAFLLKCGFKKNTKMLAKALHCVLHKSTQDVNTILHAIMSLGLSRNHACRLVKLQPTILQQKPAEITSKLDYILNTLCFSFEDLFKYSSFMIYSLDSHIRPRYLMHGWLKSKRFLRRNFKLDYIMSMSEKQFLCKFVECHEDGVIMYHGFMGNVK